MDRWKNSRRSLIIGTSHALNSIFVYEPYTLLKLLWNVYYFAAIILFITSSFSVVFHQELLGFKGEGLKEIVHQF